MADIRSRDKFPRQNNSHLFRKLGDTLLVAPWQETFIVRAYGAMKLTKDAKRVVREIYLYSIHKNYVITLYPICYYYSDLSFIYI